MRLARGPEVQAKVLPSRLARFRPQDHHPVQGGRWQPRGEPARSGHHHRQGGSL